MSWPPIATVAPPTGAPVSSSIVPAIAPRAPEPGAGGTSVAANGLRSVGPSVAADQPIPRAAKTPQIASQSSFPFRVTAACTIALRMSRNVGNVGASRSPSVTYARVRASPSGAPCACVSARRSDHSVCAQISPSAWISGAPRTLPKSSYA